MALINRADGETPPSAGGAPRKNFGLAGPATQAARSPRERLRAGAGGAGEKGRPNAGMESSCPLLRGILGLREQFLT